MFCSCRPPTRLEPLRHERRHCQGVYLALVDYLLLKHRIQLEAPQGERVQVARRIKTSKVIREVLHHSADWSGSEGKAHRNDLGMFP